MKLWEWLNPDQGLSDDLIDQKFYHVEKMMQGLSGSRIRLFACDCAERALPLFEREFPDDDRPRNAIMVARRHAFGIALRGELVEAYQEAMTACKTAAAAAPENPEGDLRVWPPLAVAQVALLCAEPDARAVSPVQISQLIIQAVERATGNAFKEKKWQYKRVMWYLNK